MPGVENSKPTYGVATAWHMDGMLKDQLEMWRPFTLETQQFVDIMSVQPYWQSITMRTEPPPRNFALPTDMSVGTPHLWRLCLKKRV